MSKKGQQKEKTENEKMYMIVRFRDETGPLIRNAMCGQSGHILQYYNGKFLGITEMVQVFEDDDCQRWPKNRGVMVLEFTSEKEARELSKRWLAGDPKFRNQDFPLASDGLEIFLLPKHNAWDGKEGLTFALEELSSISDTQKLQDEYVKPVADVMDKFKIQHGGLTFALEELSSISDTQKLQDEYVKPVAGVMDKFKIQHGVGFSTEVEGLRSSPIRRGNPVVLHGVESEKQFRDFYYSEECVKLRQTRKKYCNPSVAVFTLNPLRK